MNILQKEITGLTSLKAELINSVFYCNSNILEKKKYYSNNSPLEFIEILCYNTICITIIYKLLIKKRRKGNEQTRK